MFIGLLRPIGRKDPIIIMWGVVLGLYCWGGAGLCLFITEIAEGWYTQIYDSSEDLSSEMTHLIFRKSLAVLALNTGGFK